ncbi:hypothetical protein VXS06_14680 [Photobacterium toruni]|uniref:Uncharacterized protein n=1 Tax=Photobacterium toruni TaxID=1935446 RepID=A0ABU6L8X6_9GAMM|nr:hypothetical protein [Photobacterium toruni]
MTTENNTNPEWEFVKAIVTANNTCDRKAVYKLISEFDFNGKYQAIGATISAINIVEDEISNNLDVLNKFVDKYKHEFKSKKINFRESLRLAILQDVLEQLNK